MNVLITGVSQGIGNALRNEYLNQGYRVWGISRKPSSLQEVKPHYKHIQFDWSDFSQLQLLLENSIRGHRIDIVVNNAGHLSTSLIQDLEIDDFNKHMKINVWQVLELSTLLIQKGFLNDPSHIVNIGSMGGVQGTSKFKSLFAYSASKAALATLTECLDAEYGGGSLAFNYLALGAVNTEMLNNAFPGYVSQVNPENMAKFIVNFSISSGQLMSGRIIQVAKVDPNV